MLPTTKNLQWQLRHEEAAKNWANNQYRGTLACATGWGKTKCAISDCFKLLREDRDKPLKTLVIVYRESHRDTTWPNEIREFNQDFMEHPETEIICWASVTKHDIHGYDLIILDEAHHISEDTYNHLSMFSGAMLALTATPPHEPDKAEYLRSMAPICYVYGLEKGVVEGINSPYIMHVIGVAPDNTRADIKAGTKVNPFMTTELKHLKFLDDKVKRAMIQFGTFDHWMVKQAVRQRMDAIYNSLTKKEAAVMMLREIWTQDVRLLGFGGSIDQISTITKNPEKYTFHSKERKTRKNLVNFCDKKQNFLLTVGMVDEGENIPELDVGFIIQTNSSQRRLIQRIGRTVRFRAGHTANMYMLFLSGTQDEKWVMESISGLPSHRFKIFRYNSPEEITRNANEWLIMT